MKHKNKKKSHKRQSIFRVISWLPLDFCKQAQNLAFAVWSFKFEVFDLLVER